jgi:GT2 family glycosyltransferase
LSTPQEGEPKPLDSDPDLKSALAYIATLGPLVDDMWRRIRSMEMSRFWKLRNAFFALKHRLGLSADSAWPPYKLPLLHASVSRLNDAYGLWLQRNLARPSDLGRMRDVIELLPSKPLITVVMATHETPEALLREAIDSVREQVYPHWELCIADDASKAPHVRRVLSEYAALDARIKVTYRPERGHISRAFNTAIEAATGELVGFLDHDDLLTPDALFEVAVAINRFPDTDMLYSDEDKIDEAGVFCEPHFKPDWCPDSFLSRMYTCHFGVYRRSLLLELNGLRPEFDGSQDYDLVLRLTERTQRIRHIPRVLYHWRKHAGSTSGIPDAKPYSSRAAERALEEALERRGEAGTVSERDDCVGVYLARYAISDPKLVSVIVPTRDHGDDVDRCLTSLFAKAGYDRLEVVVLDNGSTDRASLEVFDRWSREPHVKILRYDVPFNFSRINNYAVAHTTGEYLLLLNNDTEAKSEGFVAAMVEQAQRPSIGAVGALLLYPDDTIQHAGVVIGLGGVAGHSHKNFPLGSNGYNNMLKAINNYSAVTGACLMMRRNVFDEVGGFDEELTVSFNDVDLCLKVIRAGYRIVCLPHVQLYHFESRSRGHDVGTLKIARSLSEQRKMRERWAGIIAHDPCYSANLTLDHEDYSIRTGIA